MVAAVVSPRYTLDLQPVVGGPTEAPWRVGVLVLPVLVEEPGVDSRGRKRLS